MVRLYFQFTLNNSTDALNNTLPALGVIYIYIYAYYINVKLPGVRICSLFTVSFKHFNLFIPDVFM